MEDLAMYYELFECNPEDSDYVLNEKYDQLRRKYQNNALVCENIKKAFAILEDSRNGCVQPGDIKGEERNLRNIEHELLECQKNLAEGFKKIDCFNEISSIKLSILKLTPFWLHSTKKNLENTGFAAYCESQYEEDIKNFFEEQMQKRILGSKDDKIFGWLKNYDAEKGDFVHYARKSMTHIRSDLKKELCNICTAELNESKLENRTAFYGNASVEDEKTKKKAEKKKQEIIKKYDHHKFVWILAKGPYILKLWETTNATCQETEFARYYMANIVLTFIKAVILPISLETISAKIIDFMIGRELSSEHLSANLDDIYEAMDQEFVNYMMLNPCMDLDDMIVERLHTYQELGIEKSGDIRFFKGGIKFIDEILVHYYAAVKSEPDKKSQSMKTIRTRHWNKFEKLVLMEKEYS